MYLQSHFVFQDVFATPFMFRNVLAITFLFHGVFAIPLVLYDVFAISFKFCNVCAIPFVVHDVFAPDFCSTMSLRCCLCFAMSLQPSLRLRLTLLFVYHTRTSSNTEAIPIRTHDMASKSCTAVWVRTIFGSDYCYYQQCAPS